MSLVHLILFENIVLTKKYLIAKEKNMLAKLG